MHLHEVSLIKKDYIFKLKAHGILKYWVFTIHIQVIDLTWLRYFINQLTKKLFIKSISREPKPNDTILRILLHLKTDDTKVHI